MISAHTPGPSFDFATEVHMLLAGYTSLADAPDELRGLIAAAPRMKRVLEMFLECWPSHALPWDEARAILRDVEGENNG